MGLEKSQQSSPDLAEKLSYLATLLPPAPAAEVFEHLTGQQVSPSRVECEAKMKGAQALLDPSPKNRGRTFAGAFRLSWSTLIPHNRPSGPRWTQHLSFW